MQREANKQLEKGKYYSFNFYKKIEFEGEDYWLCIDPFNKKHMLKSAWYDKYNFEAGKDYSCRIDKINCTGQLFIEPEHPIYKERQAYPFTVTRVEVHINDFGDPETHLKLLSRYNDEAEISFLGNKEMKNGETIDLFLYRIQKGKLLLFPPADKINYSYLKRGEEYIFTIRSVMELFPEKEYFVLEDEKDHIHYLRKKFYESFHFKKNDKVKCRLLEEPNPGIHYLEPEYPDYESRQVYEFVFLREGEYYFSDFGKREIYFVADQKDRECVLIYQSEMKPDVSNGFVSAKVMYNYQGKLFLQAQNLSDMLNSDFLN